MAHARLQVARRGGVQLHKRGGGAACGAAGGVALTALDGARALELAVVLGLVELDDAALVEELEVLHVGHLLRLGQRLLGRRARALRALEVALVVRGAGALALAHR
eukprot:3811142-Prymnesium_polylepis.1